MSKEVAQKCQNLGRDSSLLMIVVFNDVSLDNLRDGGTQGGHLILLMGKDEKFSPNDVLLTKFGGSSYS